MSNECTDLCVEVELADGIIKESESVSSFEECSSSEICSVRTKEAIRDAGAVEARREHKRTQKITGEIFPAQASLREVRLKTLPSPYLSGGL